MENLDLVDSNKQLLYGSKRLNAKLSSFAYAKITQAIESRALKQGVYVYKTNPAFTSQIGKIKYMKQKGLSIHISAAYVIARRVQGFKEQVPKDLRKYIPEKNVPKHHWSHWRALSTQLKSVHPKFFYKKISFDEHLTLKDYSKALQGN